MEKWDFEDFLVAICVTADTAAELDAQMPYAKRADLVEYRADLSRLPFREAIKTLKDGGVKVLFTFRTLPEGGRGEDALYEENILAAINAGADAVDIEFVRAMHMHRVVEEAKKRGVLVVYSAHFFTGMPDQKRLTDLYKKMDASGCGIAKIAVAARNREDVLTLKEASFQSGDFPKVVLAMGEEGRQSRLYPEEFDGIMTFLSGKMASAPGQMDMETFLKWRKQSKTEK